MASVTYRIGQAIQGTFGRADPAEIEAALGELPESLRPVFRAMRPRDQRHAVGVLRRLGPAPAVLRQAALLHDVGKAEVFLGTPGRTLVVLARATRMTALLVLVPWLGGRVRRYMQHPAIGAEMVREAGGVAELVEIIAEHQEDRPRHPETLRLQAADGRE